jgi:RNA-binding protein 8A
LLVFTVSCFAVNKKAQATTSPWPLYDARAGSGVKLDIALMAEEVDFDEQIDLPADEPTSAAARAASTEAAGSSSSGGAPAGGKAKATDAAGRCVKGRGAMGSSATTMTGSDQQFESIQSKGSTRGPLKSVEGWIIFVTGVHEEAQEEDVHDKFADFGDIRNLHLNLDRRTGFVKGYALIEYANQSEAQGAIDEMDGAVIMGQPIHVDWAFRAGPSRHGGASRR